MERLTGRSLAIVLAMIQRCALLGFAVLDLCSASTGQDRGEADPSTEDSKWLSEVSESIHHSEYEFRPVPGEENVWSAPNRLQSLRMRASIDGLHVFPRTTLADGLGAPWSLRWCTRGCGRSDDSWKEAQPTLTVSGGYLELDHGSFVKWIENTEEGIEQGWRIGERPDGNTTLEINLELGGLTLRVEPGGRSAVLLDMGDEERLRCVNLRARDMSSRELQTLIDASPSGALLRIEDQGAQYPITVALAFTGSAQNAEDPGILVSLAAVGDVTGDGHRDGIVIAEGYDDGVWNTDRVFLCPGTAEGLGTTSSWTFFGSSASFAGDLDGDGFGDVIVGRDGHQVFLFEGASGGLELKPAWRIGGGVRARSPLANQEATAILKRLVVGEEWKEFGSPAWLEKSVNNTLLDYGEMGRLLSIGSFRSEVQLVVESPGAMRLRHKINVGTDLREWEIVRRETSYPEDRPFRRTYLLASPPGFSQPRLKGLLFFEGAMLELDSDVTPDDPRRDAFESFIWRTAVRLAEVYDDTIRLLAEGVLFAGSVWTTRPDLPDPDLTR